MALLDLIRDSIDQTEGIPFPPLNQLPPPGSVNLTHRTLLNTLHFETGKQYHAVRICSVIISKVQHQQTSTDVTLLLPNGALLNRCIPRTDPTATSTVKHVALEQVVGKLGADAITGFHFVRLLESEDDRGKSIIVAVVVVEVDIEHLRKQSGLEGMKLFSEEQVMMGTGGGGVAKISIGKQCLMAAFESRKKSTLEASVDPGSLLGCT